VFRTLLESVTGYPGLLLACAASGVVLPFPEDFPLLYAGMRVADGDWGWGATILVATIGVALRDALAWTFGRVLGDLLLNREGVRRWVGARGIDRARRLVTRHGAGAVLLGRFMIGFRSPVFAVAGAMGVPLRSFATWDGLGLALAVPLTVALGYEFGQPLVEAGFLLLQRTRLLVAVLVIASVALGAWRMSLQPVSDDETESL
jgi:membrane protein DedA with SNARE-associated domain